jgi:hypothetical protein
MGLVQIDVLVYVYGTDRPISISVSGLVVHVLCFLLQKVLVTVIHAFEEPFRVYHTDITLLLGISAFEGLAVHAWVFTHKKVANFDACESELLKGTCTKA